MGKVNGTTKYLEAKWTTVLTGDGGAQVRTAIEEGAGTQGALIATYPLAMVAEAVVAAHNKTVVDAQEYSTMIRVVYGSHAEAALVQKVLPTPRMRGQVLFDTARANK